MSSPGVEGRDPSAGGDGPTSAGGGDGRPRPGRLPTVGRVVAVGSGKGGVGKSTVAANLALALREEGLQAGILDADIYGPSVPMILGVEDAAARARMTDDRKILPLEAHGLAFVSFGFFLGEGSPAIWRGPLVAKAVRQVSRGVVWPELDLLVVDLPPGTGDVPLTLAGSIAVDAAVVVTTPQKLAAAEAARAVAMFRKLEVPVAGIVENMSWQACGCGRIHRPFGSGGGRRLARETEVPLLGEIPLGELVDPESGRERLAVVEAAASETASAFRDAAGALRRALEELGTGTPEAGGASRKRALPMAGGR